MLVRTMSRNSSMSISDGVRATNQLTACSTNSLGVLATFLMFAPSSATALSPKPPRLLATHKSPRNTVGSTLNRSDSH